MPTREQVIAELRAGASYQDVADRLKIPPGQAYMIATGLPADGSDVLSAQLLASKDEFLLDGSSQHLVNPQAEISTENEDVREWIRSRVAADGPLREAARQRTATPPEKEHRSEKDDTDDVIDLLGRDHNQVKYLEEQLETIPAAKNGGTEEQQQRRVSIVDMIRVRLSEHEQAEEDVFWPAVRTALPDGDEVADQAHEQEEHGTELLQQLAGLSGGDERFDDLVEQLISALGKHVAFEDAVFLRVREAVPAERLGELGRQYTAAKQRVTREAGPRPADRQGQAEDEPLPEGDQ